MTTPRAGVSEAKQPIRCLVIQLARLGDTLQSLMALRAAKELYPDLEITFVARERFAAAAQRVTWLREVITLPTDALLGPALAGAHSEMQAYKELARWSAKVIARPWDVVVNWTYSEASSYLAALASAKVKLGYSRRKDLSLSSMDGWSHYLQAVVQGDVPQNIHLTDILTTQLLTALQIHYGDPTPAGTSSASSRQFFSSEIDDFCNILHSDWTKRDLSRRWVAIQLGAARADKAWSPGKWAAVATLIAKRHPEYRFALLGGASDVSRGKAFLSAWEAAGQSSEKVLNMVGQTDFDLWSAVIGGAQWLFSCDTAALHLASTLGTRVLNVSVGPVRFMETGPYGNAHYVVTPAKPCAGCRTGGKEPHSCHDDVSPEAVYATWTYGATEWSHQRKIAVAEHFSQLGWSRHLSRISVYRSSIRDAQDGGGVQYEPVCRRPLEASEWTALVIEQVARFWYCGWTPPVGKGLNRDAISPALVKELREMHETSQVLRQVCEEAHRLSTLLGERGKILKSERLMSLQDKADLQTLSSNIRELDNLLQTLGTNHASLAAFSQMARVLMHNIPGKKLWEVAEESAICYRQLADGVKLFNDWVTFSLSLAKPVAVAASKAQAVDLDFSAT